MRRSQHTDEEILSLLAEAQTGIAINAICATAHISIRTFYRWRKQFGGLTLPALARMRWLEEENRSLRRKLDGLASVRRRDFGPPSRPQPGRLEMGDQLGRGRSCAADLVHSQAPVRVGAVTGRFSALRTTR